MGISLNAPHCEFTLDETNPEIILTGFPKTSLVQSCLDTSSQDTHFQSCKKDQNDKRITIFHRTPSSMWEG